MKNKKIYIILASVAMFILSCITVSAAVYVNINEPVKIEASCVFDGTEISDMYLELYKVADMDSYGDLYTTPQFSAFENQVLTGNYDQILQLAEDMNKHVIVNGISPADSGRTDAKGSLIFPAGTEKLTPGLYLISDGHHIQGDYIYESRPFLVYLPFFTDGESHYGIKMSPKYSRTPVDDVYTKITVVKVWKDSGYENRRPNGITVTLYNGKTACETITLNTANNWRYSWQYLDKTGNWSVVENPVADYTTATEKDGTTYIITNTYKNPPSVPELPNTGQNWLPAMALFALGLVLVIAGAVRRQTGDYEK